MWIIVKLRDRVKSSDYLMEKDEQLNVVGYHTFGDSFAFWPIRLINQFNLYHTHLFHGFYEYCIEFSEMEESISLDSIRIMSSRSHGCSIPLYIHNHDQVCLLQDPIPMKSAPPSEWYQLAKSYFPHSLLNFQVSDLDSSTVSVFRYGVCGYFILKFRLGWMSVQSALQFWSQLCRQVFLSKTKNHVLQDLHMHHLITAYLLDFDQWQWRPNQT